VVRDARAYYALIALTPAVFFGTLVASFRGYFQGFQLMRPTAVSQIIDQFTRVVFMLTLAYVLLPYGLEYAAAGAAFGAVPGSVAGLCLLLYFYQKYKKSLQPVVTEQPNAPRESMLTIAKTLVKLALPVACANLMLPVVMGIDTFLVPGRLETAGFSVHEATKVFGYLAGMALPLVLMGTIPTPSLSASVVPAISEARTLGNQEAVKAKCRMALRLCSLVTFPAFIGMYVLAQPISTLLYGTKAAADVIAQLSPSLFFLGLHQVSTGILQGSGFTVVPMINMLISALVKAAAVWRWTALPQYNILGAAWASNLNFAVAAVLNIGFLLHFVQGDFPWRSLGKISITSVLMGILVLLGYKSLLILTHSNAISTLAAVVTGTVVYGLLLIGSKEITQDEIRKMPVVGKIWQKLTQKESSEDKL